MREEYLFPKYKAKKGRYMKEDKIIGKIDMKETEIDVSDAIPFEDLMKNWEEKWHNRKWYHKVWDKIWFKVFYPFKPSEIRWNFLRFKSYFIRGKKGWAPMDTWSFDYYLSPIIRDALTHLKKNNHGYPGSLDNQEEWEVILEKIIWTFDACEKIQKSDWYMLPRENYIMSNGKLYYKDNTEYEELRKNYEEIAVKYNNHVMTDEELLKYEEGWRLFKEYYFSLWD
jgi:hypothetical protein